MHWIEIIFWVSLFGAVYSYAVYPLILIAVPRRRKKSLAKCTEYPSVSIIIAGYNEESRIRAKLENTLKIDYPRDRFEIIVASDASSDATATIVRDFEIEGVRLIESPERRGKEAAQALGIAEARGDLLIFSDVSTQLPSESVGRMVENFADPRIGAVSSEDRFISSDGKIVGEGAYIKYEMWLRRLESKKNTIVGLTGAFFAVRRKLCEHWDIQVPSDFNSALNCVRNNMVAVSDPTVLCYYPDIQDESREYQRKQRTVIRGLAAVFRHPSILNPFVFGLASFQIWSHKIARWLVPWFLLTHFIIAATLYDQAVVYRILFAGQVAFYGIALLAFAFRRLRFFAPCRIIYYFVMANVAIAEATIRFLVGQRVVLWTPSKR